MIQRFLQKQHLVCVASQRERALDEAINEEVHEALSRRRRPLLEQRTAAHEALRSHRVMVLDVASEELPAAMVERYFAVRRDGLL